jgi:plastocyanin
MHPRHVALLVGVLASSVIGCGSTLAPAAGASIPSSAASPTPGQLSGANASMDELQLACGQLPSLPAPPSDGPTPQVASGSPESTLVVAGIGVWPSCFRPEVLRIQTGEVVQWELVALPDVDIVLDDGVAIGPVLHNLEVRFNRPGTYPYHAGRNPSARGTIIVEGARQPGPALEIWSPAGHRVVDSIP